MTDTARRYDPSSGLEALALSLSMARGLDEVMAAVRSAARPLIGADGVTFVLRDGDECWYAEEDAISPLWKGRRFPVETCVSGYAMRHRELVVIEDIEADDRVPHAAFRSTFVRSLALAPVRRDDPIAAIGAYWAEPRRPAAEQLIILQSIANFAAVALTNVPLFGAAKGPRAEAAGAGERAPGARPQVVHARDAVIMAMASLAATRDDDTTNHVHRTRDYIRALAMAAHDRGLFPGELTAGLIDLLHQAAPLHDIGKIGIPDRVLLKPGPLDEDERAIMRTHAELGRRAIEAVERHFGDRTPFFRIAREIAHTHHERWDGTGYPRGLKGAGIPLSGRLMAIADVYDALVSKRVYKDAIAHDEAVAIILAERGRHFDPQLVDLFAGVGDRFRAIHGQFADPPRDGSP
ncbi:MAG: HD domain-containing protein [Rhizobiaceae bacterium]|nr:HD domain-containing protein [Rhizobiaceae bacterium]